MNIIDDPWEPTPEIVFMQLLLAAGYISKTALEERIAELNRKLSSSRTLEQIRAEANSTLGAVGMELIEVRDDFAEGTEFFALITREPLPAFLNKLVLSQSHAAQLTAMLARMFADSRCEGVSIASLPASAFPAKNEIIPRMLEQHRFAESCEGRVFIGTRLLYELEDYLREEYGGSTLLPCLGCEKWLLKGKLCTNETCAARLHERCYDAYFASRSLPRGECPLCSSSL